MHTELFVLVTDRKQFVCVYGSMMPRRLVFNPWCKGCVKRFCQQQVLPAFLSFSFFSSLPLSLTIHKHIYLFILSWPFYHSFVHYFLFANTPKRIRVLCLKALFKIKIKSYALTNQMINCLWLFLIPFDRGTWLFMPIKCVTFFFKP